MKTYLVKFLALAVLMCSAGCSTATSNNNSSSSVKPNSSTSTKIEDPKNYWSEIYMNPTSVVNASGQPYKVEIADPSVVRGDNGYLYCVSTDRRFLRSEDGCNWEVISENIIDNPAWGKEYSKSGYNLWAPDLIKIGDKWIYYYSLSGWGSPIGIGYATADDIEGPYTDQGKLFTGDEMGVLNCIDPQPFVDVDGTVYMTVGSFQGLWLVELTKDGMGLEGGIEYQKENKVLIAGKVGGWDGSTYEGGYIMRKEDKYYYFGSAGTCCEGKNSTYRVLVGRAEEITGPYLDAQGRPLTASGSGKTFGTMCLDTGITNKNMSGAGHNSILVDDAGDYWIYYHAYSTEDNYATRHLFMDKLAWDENGFPYVTYTYTNDEGEEKTSKVKPSFILL